MSASAISRAERVDGPPPMQLRNLAAIRIAFERNGIELIDDVGVKLRRA